MTALGEATEQLNKIVDDGLCLGCGLCAAIAPEAIKMTRGEDGDLRPIANDQFDDEKMALVNQICPSLRIEGLPEDLASEAPHQDTVWGPYYEMSLAHSADANVRHEASTAGILTALAIYLLETNKVDAICHVKAADSPANFGVATISRTRQDVIEASGSRYGPTAALVDIESVLSSDENFALIAKPCDLNAMRNLAHIDSRVNQRISYWLTLLCGGFQPDASFNDFLRQNNLSNEGLSQVRYRGFGCPGPTSLTYEDGSKTSFHYLDFWGEDESQWSMPLRCKICADGIGEAADVVAGDAWQGASPDRVESETDKGFNSVITRTKKGQNLYQDAIGDGYITITDVVDRDYLSAVQPHQVTKKLAGQARVDGLRKAGSVAPEIVNMRAEALSEMLGLEGFDEQKEGAFERAKALKKQN